jgi:hypothetical protein
MNNDIENLEMPIEMFAEAVVRENTRLRAVLQSIAEGGVADNLEDAYMDVLRQAREALGRSDEQR